MTERDEFGPSLRRERERRGITLQQIAAQTKIAVSVFEALERNDFSRWPGGLFRRSFVRSYAQAVGLDSERVVRDFLRLFPADEDTSGLLAALVKSRTGVGPSAAETGAHGAPKPSEEGPHSWRRLAVAAAGFALAGGVGTATALTLAWPYGVAVAAIGVLTVIATSLRAGGSVPGPPPEKSESPVVVAAPPTQARHVTTRRTAERHQTARQHRPRRGGRRRPRA